MSDHNTDRTSGTGYCPWCGPGECSQDTLLELIERDLVLAMSEAMGVPRDWQPSADVPHLRVTDEGRVEWCVPPSTTTPGGASFRQSSRTREG